MITMTSKQGSLSLARLHSQRCDCWDLSDPSVITLDNHEVSREKIKIMPVQCGKVKVRAIHLKIEIRSDMSSAGQSGNDIELKQVFKQFYTLTS